MNRFNLRDIVDRILDLSIFNAVCEDMTCIIDSESKEKIDCVSSL